MTDTLLQVAKTNKVILFMDWEGFKIRYGRENWSTVNKSGKSPLILPSAINEETKLHKTLTLFFKVLFSYKSDTDRWSVMDDSVKGR